MTEVFVGIGTNFRRRRSISGALAALNNHFGELSLSSIYESEAVRQASGYFLNMVVGFETEQGVAGVCDTLRLIEYRQGRRRGREQGGLYPLDLDLLLYGDLCGSVNGRLLPHRDLLCHAFVLQPLAEIAGERICPGNSESFSQLWSRLSLDPATLKPLLKACSIDAIDFGHQPGVRSPESGEGYLQVGSG